MRKKKTVHKKAQKKLYKKNCAKKTVQKNCAKKLVVSSGLSIVAHPQTSFRAAKVIKSIMSPCNCGKKNCAKKLCKKTAQKKLCKKRKNRQKETVQKQLCKKIAQKKLVVSSGLSVVAHPETSSRGAKVIKIYFVALHLCQEKLCKKNCVKTTVQKKLRK